MEEEGVLDLKIANVYSLSSIVRKNKPKSETRGDLDGDENSLPRSDSTFSTVKTVLHNVADDSKHSYFTVICTGSLEKVNKDRVEYAEKCLQEGTKESCASEKVKPLAGNTELKTDKKHIFAAKRDGKIERTLGHENVSKAPQPQKKYGNSNFRRFGTDLDRDKVTDSSKVSLICDEKQGQGNMYRIHSADVECESKKVSKQSASPNLYDVVKERRKARFLQRNDSNDNQPKKDGKRDHSIDADAEEPRCKKKKSELDKRDLLDELGCLVVLEDIEDSLAGRSKILWRHWMRRFEKCGRSCRQKYVDALYRKILRMKKSAKIRFENVDEESVYSNRNMDKTNQNFTTSGSIIGDKMELDTDIEMKPLKVTTKVMSETKLITEGEEEKEVKVAVGGEKVTSDCKSTAVSKNNSDDIVNGTFTAGTNDTSSLNKTTAVCKAQLRNKLVTQAQRKENSSANSLEGRAKTESECPRASSCTSFHGPATSIPSSNASVPNTAASNAVITNASTSNSFTTNVPPSNAFTKDIPAPNTLTSIPISNALTTKAPVTNSPTTNDTAIKAALQSGPFFLGSINGSLVLVPIGQMTFQTPCIRGHIPLSVSYSQGHQVLGNFLSPTCPAVTTQQTVQYAQTNIKIDTMNKGTVCQYADKGMNVRCNESTMQTYAANQTFPTTQRQSVVAVQNLPTQNASFQPGSALGQQALDTHQSFLPTNNDIDNRVIVKKPRQSDPKSGLFTIRKKRGKKYEEVVVSTYDELKNCKYGQHEEEVEIEKKHMDPDLSHLPIAPVPNSSITWSWTSEAGVSTFFYPLTCSSSLMVYIDKEESIRQRLLENISYQERIVCKQSLVSRQALTRDYIFSLFVFMNDVVRKSISLNLFHFDTLLSNYVKRETELRQKYNCNENKNEDNDGQSLVLLNRQENITDTHIRDNFCRRQKILVKTFVRYSKWPRNIEAADQMLSGSKSDSRTCSENSNGNRINIEKYENEVTSTVPGNVKTEECNDGVHKKMASDQVKICTKTIEELKEESKFLKSLSTDGNVVKLSNVTLIPVPTDSGSRKSTTCDSRKGICGKKEKYRDILPSSMAQICRKESQQANTAAKTALSEYVKLPHAFSSVGQNDVSTSKVTKLSEKQSNPWIRSEVGHSTSLIPSVPPASVVQQSISTSLQPSTVETAKQLSQEPKYVMLGDGSLIPIVQSQKVVQNIASAGERFVQMPDGTAVPIVGTQVRNDKPPQQLFQLPDGSLVSFPAQPPNLMQNITGNVQLTNQSLKLSDGTAIPVINETSNVVKNVGTSVQPTNSILELPDGSLVQAVNQSQNTLYNGVQSNQAYQSLNVSGTPLVGHLKNLVQSVSKTVNESSSALSVTVMPAHLPNANYVQNISSNNVSQANNYLKMQDGSFVPIINPGQNLTSVLNNHQLLVNSQSAQMRSFNSPLPHNNLSTLLTSDSVGQNANASVNTKVEMTSNRNILGSLSVQNPLAENPVTQNKTIHLQKSLDGSNKLLGNHGNQFTTSKYKSFRDKKVSSLLKRNRSTPTINDNYCSTEDIKPLSVNDSNIILETGLEGPEVEYKRMKQKRKEEAVTRVDPDERRSKKSTIPPLGVPVVEGPVAAETVYNNTVPLNKVKEEISDDFSIEEKGLRIPHTMIPEKTHVYPLLPVKTEPIDF